MMLARPNTAGGAARLAIALVAAALLPGRVDVAAGGSNGVCNFPDGIHGWGYAGQQLQQMKPDIQRVLGVTEPSRT